MKSAHPRWSVNAASPGRRALATLAVVVAGLAGLASVPAADPPPAPATTAWATVVPRPAGDEPEPGAPRLEALVRAAARRGARYVVTPELALLPAGADARALRGRAETIPGPTTELASRLARELGIWIGISLPEIDAEGPGYFVTAVLVDDQGVIAYTQRRILVDGEREPGAERGSFRAIADTLDDHGLRLGIVSGGDLLVGVARLAERGAETVLVPAAWGGDELAVRDQQCRELSRQFAVNLVVANRRPVGEAASGGEGWSGAVYRVGGEVERAPAAEELLLARLPRRRLPWEIASALGLPASVPLPAFEPASAELAELGRTLFTDPGMSSTGEVSCITCHRPDLAFTNGQQRGVGVFGRQTKRNVPSLLNVAFRPLLRWDGYASMLENFVKYPISGFSEMNFHYLDKMVAYIRARPDYVERFRTVMGVEEVEFEDVARALATYQRTLISGNSAFDRHYYGGEEQVLDAAARRGLALFQGKADCARCHAIGDRYALFMDFQYHFLGIGFDPEPGHSEDIGLGGISTNDLAGYFQTPSLRNVALTAPYMHDGSLATLEDVVEFFDRGGPADPARPVELAPLGLTPQEKADLVAFLRSLSGDQRYDNQGRLLLAAQDR